MECQRFPCVALILLLATLFVTTSCAVNPVTGEQEIMLLSESDEIRLGRKTDGEIEKAYGLAGVIGHEIGHIAARHSAQRLSKAQLTQLGLGVGSVLSQTFREYASVPSSG
jgi:predicted Zn-dependent protease